MSVTPRLENHNWTAKEIDEPIDAFIFINPDTNEEYSILGAGVMLNDPLEGINTYATMSTTLDAPAKAFGFIATNRVHRFNVGDTFRPDYVVPYNNPLAVLMGITTLVAHKLS